MAKFPFFCTACGYKIDQTTGLCPNPNCPNHTTSQLVNQQETK